MCSPRVRPTRRTLTPQMQRERSFGTASIYLGTIAVMAYSYVILLPVYRLEHSVAATATVAAWSQLLGILALVLLRACFVDPGLVSQLAVGDGWPKCRVCQEPRPPSGSHHCRSCDACVAGFDHHCSVLGVCIARGNRHFFVGLLGAATLCLLPLAYATFACARLELLRAGGWSLLLEPSRNAPQLAWLGLKYLPAMMGLSWASAAVAAGCVFHVALLLCGSTTREFDRSAQRVLRRWRGRLAGRAAVASEEKEGEEQGLLGE